MTLAAHTLPSQTTGLVCAGNLYIFTYESGDEFLIEPILGELEPGSFIELKLTLTAASTPSVYEGECECTIVWENRGTPN